MLIDCHAHLNFQAYNNDREEVIKRCQNLKVINIGSQFPTSRLALELARKHENMYASVGLHPIHVLEQKRDENEIREKVQFTDEEQLTKIRELLKSDLPCSSRSSGMVRGKDNRIVAVGETGLDYYRLGMSNQSSVIREEQKKVFLKQIKLAKEFNKPLILHCRGSKENPQEAYQKVLSTINNYQSTIKGGMIHCFSASLDIAQKFIDLGFYIGFTGIITFPPRRGSGSSTNAGDLINVVKQVPLNRIITETDCPYLAPQEVRGQRNEPRYVEYIAHEIAKIKGIEYDEVIKAVEENVRELFKI